MTMDKSNLGNSLSNIDAFDESTLLIEQSCTKAQLCSMYSSNFGYNSEDRNGFVTRIAGYIKRIPIYVSFIIDES